MINLLRTNERIIKGYIPHFYRYMKEHNKYEFMKNKLDELYDFYSKYRLSILNISSHPIDSIEDIINLFIRAIVAHENRYLHGLTCGLYRDIWSNEAGVIDDNFYEDDRRRSSSREHDAKLMYSNIKGLKLRSV
mgnify:CR=1 FL=1